MKAQSHTTTKKKLVTPQNTIEALKNLASPSATIDHLLGNYEYDDYDEKPQAAKPQPRQEFTVFNAQEHHEAQSIQKEIRELTEQVRQEIEMVKRADSTLLSQVKDVEKLTLDSQTEKPGIYQLRFLEVVLSILRTIRLKIGESRTWLEALMSKKKKRGSLFATLSKKKGTQYSLSQELQTARSVQ